MIIKIYDDGRNEINSVSATLTDGPSNYVIVYGENQNEVIQELGKKAVSLIESVSAAFDKPNIIKVDWSGKAL